MTVTVVVFSTFHFPSQGGDLKKGHPKTENFYKKGIDLVLSWNKKRAWQ